MFAFFYVLFAALFITAVIGHAMGDKKGRGLLGFVLGFLLGPIGLVIIFKMQRRVEWDGMPVIPRDTTGMNLRKLLSRQPMISPDQVPPGFVPCPSCQRLMVDREVVCPRCGTRVRDGMVEVPEASSGGSSTYSPIEPEPWWFQDEPDGPPPPGSPGGSPF